MAATDIISSVGLPIVGGILGGITSADKASNLKKYYKQLAAGEQGIQGDVSKMSGQQQATLANTYAPQLQGYGQNVQDYNKKMTGTDMSQFNVAPKDFTFDMQAETQRQMNPELQAIIDRQTGALQQSAAGQNKLFSGAAGKGIARSTADITAKEYGAAAGRAQQEESNKYNQWTQAFNQSLESANQNRSNLQQNLSNLGTVVGNQTVAQNAQGTGQLGIQQGADTATLQSKQTALGATANANNINPWMAGLQGVMGGIGSAAKGVTDIMGAGGYKSSSTNPAQGVGSMTSGEQ